MFMQKAAMVAWSYPCSQNAAQECCAEQLGWVTSASCHTQCSLPSSQSVTRALWLLTQCTMPPDFCSSFLEECLVLECAAALHGWKRADLLSSMSLTQDFSKSSTNPCRFHLAIFVCLNSPCAFFPVITLLAGVWSYPQRHLLAGTR